MLLSLTRVARLALQQFHRNLWLSIATITLLILSLLTVNLIIGLGAVAQSATSAIKNKIDVSVYFNPTVTNEQVEIMRKDILALSEVASAELLPREAVLMRFKERHSSDPVIMESLEELSENPFGATLVVQAKDPEQYPRIVAFLEDPKYADLVGKKSFEDHRLVIARINTLMRNVRSFGLAVSAVFGVIAVLVVINTVRVAVYTHRGEIRVMRLVGASNWFIRGPFLFEAFIFSLTAVVLTAAAVYAGLHFVQPYFDRLFDGINLSLIRYYNLYALSIFGLQFLGILLLTTLSSALAVRRYLRV